MLKSTNMHPSCMGHEKAFFIGLLNLITSLLNIIPIQYPLKVFAKTQRQHRAIEGLYCSHYIIPEPKPAK